MGKCFATALVTVGTVTYRVVRVELSVRTETKQLSMCEKRTNKTNKYYKNNFYSLPKNRHKLPLCV